MTEDDTDELAPWRITLSSDVEWSEEDIQEFITDAVGEFEVYRTTENFFRDGHEGRLVLVGEGESPPKVCPFCEGMNCLEKVELEIQ